MMKRLGFCVLAGSVGLAVLLSQGSGDAREKKGEQPRRSKESGSRIGQPALAVQLALEGQRRKSPTLMLAAIELLAPLKESGRSLKDVKGELKGEKSADKPLSVSVADWVDLARDYAKNDKEMTAFLEKKLEGLTSRGLIYSQGKDLKTFEIKGLTFKILWSGTLNPNQEYVASNAIFEANRPADVVVVADLGAKIDLLVTDDVTKAKIGQRVGDTPVVCWDPKMESRARIGVLNAGPAAARVVVLVSW